MIESGRYDTREDFTVVVQPFFENVYLPKTPVKKTSIMDKWGGGGLESAQLFLSAICVTQRLITWPLLSAL